MSAPAVLDRPPTTTTTAASPAPPPAATEPPKEEKQQQVAISEADMGIVAYANAAPGFAAVLKQRYSDFIVNEVGRDGQVVRLTRLESLKPPAAKGGEEGANNKRPRVEGGDGAGDDGKAAAEEEKPPELSLAERAQKAVEELGAAAGWAEDVKARLTAEMTALLGGEGAAEAQSVVLPPSEDKTIRRAQHQFFKAHFAGVLEGDTVDAPASANAAAGAKSVRLVRVGQGGKAAAATGQGHWRGYASSGNAKRQKRGRDEQGGGGKSSYDDTPKYLRFVLYKENHTTTSAVAALAKQLRIKESRFAFAGMKDKRGLTTQACSVFRVREEELLHKVNTLGAGYLRVLVGNVEASDDQLRLGGLGGNRFGIVLRNVEDGVTDAAIAEACEALGRSGFINYFGSQRFGSYGSPTSSIGVAILKRDWAGAIELVLRSRAGEDQRCQDAREYWADTKDARGALALMPRHMSIEQAVLRVLDKQGGQAHLNALQAIPRNLQLMYLHAFQSEVWNKAATHRVQSHTMAHAVAGDLVYVNDEEDEAKEGKEKRVRLVTAEEEAAGSVDIGRVVLPLPGINVQYPGHGTGDLYKQVFAERGLPMESLKNASQGDYTLGGDYRKLIARPLDFEWRLLRYADAAHRLLPTDVDRLSAEEKERLPGAHWKRFMGELKEGGDPEGPHRALCLEFTLQPSTYATMLLREVLKRSMTTDEMKKLNPKLPAGEGEGEEGGGGGEGDGGKEE